MGKKDKEIVLSKFKKCHQPWSIAYCYPAEGPIVVKGMKLSVISHVLNMSMCHYKLTCWNKGNISSWWLINRSMWGIKKISKYEDTNSNYSIEYRGESLFQMRRLPKRYIKDFKNWNKAELLLKLLEE